MKIGILAGAVGLAVSAVAIAEAAKTSDLIPISRVSTVDPEIQVFRQTGFPAETNGLVGERRLSPLNGLRSIVEPVESAQDLVSPRGGANFVIVRTDYQAFPADTSLGGLGITNPPSFTSGTLPSGIVVNLRGQTSINFVRVIDPTNALTPAPAAGPNGVANQTKMVRHRVGTSQGTDGFFLGHNTRIGTGANGSPLFPIAPTAMNPARVSLEIYNTSTAELNTFEPVATFTGFITARILWGGTCNETTPGECTDFGLPVGPITTLVSLGPDPASFTTGIFVPCNFCQDAQGFAIPGCTPPPGFSVGQAVPIPVGTWHRMIGETSSDARVNVYIDYLNGNPEVAIYSNTILTSGFLDRVGSNASFEGQDVETFFDNASFEGEPFALPTPPPRTCPFIDDIEWLNTGPVLGQTDEFFAALSSALTVINDGARGQVLSQINNISSDNKFRLEFSRQLPVSYALPGDPWSFCSDIRTTGATVRAVALDSEATNFIPGGVTARVYLGLEDPNAANPFYDGIIYVQINPEYDPIDDPFTTTPQDNIPIVGTDIASTGVMWPTGVYGTLCINVDVDNNMTVSRNGVTLFTGQAFANAATVVYYESENQAFGSGATQRVDAIDFECAALPQVTLPSFTLTYNDDMEWGIPGIPPLRHIDDPTGSPTTSTRYTNANGVVMDTANLLRGSSTVVAMANVFRDTAQIAPPDPNGETAFIFQQFRTNVPNVTVGGSTRWVVETEFAFNDFTTSRGWSPAILSPAGAAYFIGGYAWYSAQDDRFYLFGAADNAAPGDDLVVVTGPTRSSLGITANQSFDAKFEYNLSTGKIDWSINGTSLGSTNPLVVTNPVTQQPLVVRNLDAVFVWGGDDETGTPTAPFSTFYMDNLTVSTGLTPCPGDTNGDRIVNFTDLNNVLGSFGQAGPGLPGDVNDDNIVNFTDLNIVLGNFGTSCP